MRLKWVGRYDDSINTLRLLRIMWERGEVGFGGYSVKMSFALDRKIFRWTVSDAGRDWCLSLLGMRVHCMRSYGGRFV